MFVARNWTISQSPRVAAPPATRFSSTWIKTEAKKCKNLEVKGKMILSNEGNKVFGFETRASLFGFAKLHGFEASVNMESQIKATGHFVALNHCNSMAHKHKLVYLGVFHPSIEFQK